MAEHPNATLIRRGFDAFSKGDLDTLSELIAPDAVQHMPGHNPLSGDHKGRDQIFNLYGQLAERTGGTLKVDLEEVYASDDRVVTVYHSTGDRDGKHLDTRHALVFTMKGNQTIDLTDIALDETADDSFWS